jgi:hypothetical protein
MHQTTIRFSPDLWSALEHECARLGISAAQFLREAAITRLSYAAGQRGDPAYDEALGAAAAGVDEALQDMAVVGALDHREDQLESAKAITAQSMLVRERSRQIRERAAEIRRPEGSRRQWQ